MITGGVRGIGFSVAERLAEKGFQKLVLMGKEPLPPEEKWSEVIKDKESPPILVDKLKNIRALKKRGVEVKLYGGSLSDKKRLEEFFESVRSDFGSIQGAVHCAGLVSGNDPAFIKKEIGDMKTVFEPKVQGLRTLDQVLAKDELKFFILFSSVSAQVPSLGVGLSDYAAANGFMDYWADHRFQSGRTCYKSLNWPSWSETGMGAVSSSLYSAKGFLGMTTEQGLSLLEKSMAYPGKSNLVPCLVSQDKFKIDQLLTRSPLPATVYSGSKASGKKRDSVELVSENWLKEIFSEELRIPVEELDAEVPLGEMGVDSIILAGLTQALEKDLGVDLDPSLFLENPTIEAVNRYLLDKYSAEIALKIQRSDVLDHIKSPESSLVSSVPTKSETVKVSEATVQNITATSESVGRKIAVIGLACDFPGAPSKDIFLRNLREGKSSIIEVPPSRWDIDRHYSSEFEEGKSIGKWGGFIEEIEYFDADYFGLKPEEALHLDPLARRFLEVAVQTLTDAGYSQKELAGLKAGVFVGSRTSSFSQYIERPLKNTITGIGQNFIAAQVSKFLNWKGPNLVIDSACSSSLFSVNSACQSLILGESELALAGGVDILLDEKPYLTLSQGMALSPTGRCRVFDQKADGFVPGEGAGAVLLKLLDRALADGDKIYGVIEASAVNSDGRTMGMTTPNPEAQRLVVSEALAKAGITPRELGYVECHGTGTMIGDPIELKALSKVFRASTDEKRFCAVGSVKSNIGHLLSAAGVAGFIKTLLSVYHGELYPTLRCENPNPRFNFEESPFYPNLTLKAWEAEGKRLGGVSSFGFGGSNAHLILGELKAEHIAKRQSLPLVEFQRKRYWPLKDLPEEQPRQNIALREVEAHQSGKNASSMFQIREISVESE